jgi:hypothetical protein
MTNIGLCRDYKKIDMHIFMSRYIGPCKNYNKNRHMYDYMIRNISHGKTYFKKIDTRIYLVFFVYKLSRINTFLSFSFLFINVKHISGV